MLRFVVTLGGIGLLLGIVAADAGAWTVDPSGGGDFTEIQPAIDAALDGDAIEVRAGTYVIARPLVLLGKAIAVRAEAPGGAEIRLSETPESADRSSVIIFEGAEGAGTSIEGFILTGGRGSRWGDGWWQHGGGGVLCVGGASPTLRSCVIRGNSAQTSGGGIACDAGSSPLLEDCTISDNTAESGGGVFCTGGSSPTLRRSSVLRNVALLAGGGLALEDGASPALEDCTILDNEAATGGGLDCFGGSPILVDCTIGGNEARGELGGPQGDPDGAGGGIYSLAGSTPTLQGCRLAGNVAEGIGGAVCILGAASLSGCEISGNRSASGGGVYCWGNPVLESCTIAGNLAEKGGGVLSVQDSLPVISGCIVWGNAGGSIRTDGDGSPSVAYSCVEAAEVWPGDGNINLDPLFCGWGGLAEAYVDAASAGPGDGSAEDPFPHLDAALAGFGLGLSAGSPCLGTGPGGSAMGADLPSCDAAGAPSRTLRIAGGTYAAPGLALVHRASMVGGGPDATTIEGSVRGLRTGATLSDLTVTLGASGGVVVASGESPAIERCTIRNNLGGGLVCGVGSAPTVTECTIAGNSTEGDGGGVRCSAAAAPTLDRCRLVGNLARGVWSPFESTYLGGRGGGLYCEAGSTPQLVNCIVSGNLANDSGGALHAEDASPLLVNCTVSGNASRASSGGLQCWGASTVLILNCIVWGNSPESACGDLSYSLVDRTPLFVHEGAFDFERFVTASVGGVEQPFPDFVLDPPDYRLHSGSPAIDAGTSEGAPSSDIDGIARPVGSAVDLGALEYEGPIGELVLDDGEPGTEASGRWKASSKGSPYGAGSAITRQRGASYSYELQPGRPGSYEVFLWWTDRPGRARDLPIDVVHEGGSTRVLVDQRVGGGRWSSVGSFFFDASARITLQSTGKGIACADAVRLAPVIWEQTVDDGDEGTVASGAWEPGEAPDAYGGTALQSREEGASYSFRFQPPVSGNHEVFLWWPASAGGRKPVQVHIDPGSGISVVRSVDPRKKGGRWSSLGTIPADGEVTITIHAAGKGVTCADAAKLAFRP